MKKLVLILVVCFFWNCNNDDRDDIVTFTVAVPETMSKAEWRSAIEVQTAKSIGEAGKIYAYQDYIFIGEKYKGVHVIDNSDPSNPQVVSFIKIPGNEDISIKNNFLYADSAIDLVVFDISNINAITPVQRLEDVFSYYSDFAVPAEARWGDYSNVDYDNEVIVGWRLEQREEVETNSDVFFNESAAALSSNVGTGGSLARFQIVDDYLYTVGTSAIKTFDIANLSQPNLLNTTNAGWNIETMFYADGYLYLGGTNGLFINSLANPAVPEFISQFTHWDGCDPVVVDGDYAYLTLRGGNECGQELSVLEVIDVSDKNAPMLAAQHFLDNPYGLGFKGSKLFVCDGTSGLKVFDKTNPLDLQIIDVFNNVQATDVIPLDDRLLMISSSALYQYNFNAQNEISLMSVLNLN